MVGTLNQSKTGKVHVGVCTHNARMGGMCNVGMGGACAMHTWGGMHNVCMLGACTRDVCDWLISLANQITSNLSIYKWKLFS